VNYAKAARLELNPKSTRGQGGIVFHFDRQKKIVPSLGQLEEAVKRYKDAETQALSSMERAKKNHQLRSIANVGHEKFLLRGHEAVYNHMRFQVVRPGLLTDKRIAEQETHSIHLHCPQSGRYHVVYGSATSADSSDDQRATLLEIAPSLECH